MGIDIWFDRGAVNLFETYAAEEFCLKSKAENSLYANFTKATGIKIMGTGDITDEGYVDAVGDAALGVLTAGMYSTQHNSALNKEFVDGFIKLGEGKHRVGWSAVSAWDAMRIMYDALEAQKGQKFDADKFKAFVYGHKFESPRGPVLINGQSRDIVQDVYIRRVERVNGELYNVEFDVLKAVQDPGRRR